MDTLDALLDRVPVTEAARRDLRQRLQDPGRHYHDARHVTLLWERHLRFRAGLAVPAEPWDTLIACAIAFHDAVYDPRRRDSESASAALWRGAGAAVGAEGAAWVATTIEATADHLAAQPEPGMTAEAWAARLWVLDLDLTPIGEVAEEFAVNTARLRREFAHLEETIWEEGRLGFLRRLAAAPQLFRSAALAAAFEAPARHNLARELGTGDVDGQAAQTLSHPCGGCHHSRHRLAAPTSSRPRASVPGAGRSVRECEAHCAAR